MSIPDTPQKYIDQRDSLSLFDFLLTFPRDIIFKEMTSWENLHADRKSTCTLENRFRLRNANMLSLAFGGGAQ